MAAKEAKTMAAKDVGAKDVGAKDLPEYVGLPRGSEIVDLSVPTLRRWLTQKKLKRYKVGGHTLLKTSELLGLVKEAK
jgi:excisionase family DNA binding protein